MTVDQFQRWVQRKYGRALTDAELNDLAGAVGYTGGPISDEVFTNAQALVDQAAADAGIPVLQPGEIRPPVEPGGGRVEGTPSETVEVPDGPVSLRDDMDIAQAVADLRAWASSLGYTLSDAQIATIAQAIGFTGNRVSAQQLQAAKDWATANVGTLFPGGTGSGTTGGGTTAGGTTAGGTITGGTGMGGGTGGNTGGGGNQGEPYDAQGAEIFKQWFRATFGREATSAELDNYAKAIRYAGGRIEGATLARLKDIAILDQKSKGWLPTSPGQFDWTPFQYQEFQYAEQAPQFAGMEAFQFGEQAPTYQAGPGFEYQQFAAPNMEDVVRDPAYKRRLEEGQKALQTSAAAKGLLRTGATLKGLTQYGQELASEEYGKTYERAKGEYDQGYRLAMDKYRSAEDQRQAQFAGQRQGYLDRLQQAQFKYETEAQRRGLQYGADVESWRNRYNQALQQYQTNRASAETGWKAKREQDLLRWQRDYDVWRYLNDDAYRRAQIAAGQSQV